MEEHLHHADMDFILGGDKVHNALVLMEGFDHMQASLVIAKGWSSSPSSVSTGRFSGHAFRGAGPGIQSLKTLPSNYATLFCGFAFQQTTSATGAYDVVSLNVGATRAFRIGISASNKLTISNSGGTVIATGTTTIAANTWYYIEVKAFQSGASGTCELHLNGVSGEIASTTGNFGSSNFDTVDVVGQASGQPVFDVDDLYVADTSGSSPRNTFLGDVRIVTVMPSSDGAHTAWTPSGAGTHFSKVNEISGTYPDGDTTYNSDSTPGDIDSYGADDIDSGATVFAVQVNLYARKDDANTRQIAPLIRQASTDYVGTTVTLGSSYAFFSQLYNQDPVAADWTAANVNADEYGVKTIA